MLLSYSEIDFNRSSHFITSNASKIGITDALVNDEVVLEKLIVRLHLSRSLIKFL